MISVGKIEKLADRVFKASFELKYHEPTRYVKILLPQYEDDSVVHIKENDRNISEIIRLDKDVYELYFHHETSKFNVQLHFIDKVTYYDVQEYINKLVLQNNSTKNTNVKEAAYDIYFDGEAVDIDALDDNFNIVYKNENDVYGTITKGNIYNNKIYVEKDTKKIHVVSQYVKNKLKKYYVNPTVSVVDEKIKIDLEHISRVSVNISKFVISEELKENVVIETLKRYGKYDLVDLDNNVLVSDIPLDTEDHIVELRLKQKVRVVPRLVKDSNIYELIPSTNMCPIVLDYPVTSLGFVKVYPRIKSNTTKVLVSLKKDKRIVPTTYVDITFRDVFGNSFTVHSGNELDIGIYELDSIRIRSKRIRNPHYVLHGKHLTKLVNSNCKSNSTYVPEEYTLVVLDNVYEHIIIGSDINIPEQVIPYTHLYGWYVDMDDDTYVNLDPCHNKVYLDLKKQYVDKRYTSLFERVEKRQVNNVIIGNVTMSNDHKKPVQFPHCKLVPTIFEENIDGLYTNILNWKHQLNNHNALLGISVGATKCKKAILGKFLDDERDILKRCDGDLEDFVNEFCVFENERFVELIEFILSLHYVANYLDWSIDDILLEHPGYVLLLGRVYKLLSDVLCVLGMENRLLYSLSFPIDIISNKAEYPNKAVGGLPKLFKNVWEDKLLCDRFNDLYLKPWFINSKVIVMRKDADNYHGYAETLSKSMVCDYEVLSALLGTTDTEEIKNRVSICLNVNNTYNDRLVNVEYVYDVAKEIALSKKMGMINWKDRNTNDDDSHVSGPEFDEALEPLRKLCANNEEVINNYGIKETELCSVKHVIDDTTYKKKPKNKKLY